jgi:hypothetical protein
MAQFGSATRGVVRNAVLISASRVVTASAPASSSWVTLPGVFAKPITATLASFPATTSDGESPTKKVSPGCASSWLTA